MSLSVDQLVAPRPRAPRNGAWHGFSSWSRHPAPFSAWILEAAVEAARVPPGATVVDPFAGAGTLGAFLVGRGDRFLGIESHPLSARYAKAKLARPGPSEELRHEAELLAREARDAPIGPHLLSEHELVLRSIDGAALGQLVALRDRIDPDSPWAEHLRVALLACVRAAAAPGWPAPRARARPRKLAQAPVEALRERAQRMADDLVHAPRQPAGRVICADARSAESWSGLEPGSITACVTSPPYLNQLHYAEALRLELYFLGLASSWSEMISLIDGEQVMACTQQVRAEGARHCRSELRSRRPGFADELERLGRRLEDAQRLRVRGKPYHRLLWCYFHDLGQVLEHLAHALEPGARAVWIVGNSAPYDVMIDTPSLIGALASEVGLEVVEEMFLRPRGGRWRGVGQRHSRPLEERMVVLARPGWGEQQRLPGL